MVAAFTFRNERSDLPNLKARTPDQLRSEAPFTRLGPQTLGPQTLGRQTQANKSSQPNLHHNRVQDRFIRVPNAQSR